MANPTLLDIAKLNGNRKEVGLIESVLDAAPEMEILPARTVSGTSYMTVDRHSLPTTGFTKANEGIAPSKSDFKTRLVETFIFRGAVNVDKAVATAYEDGAAAYQAIEAQGVMRSAMIEIGKQVYYGTEEDANGFDGLQAINTAHVAGGSGLRIDATGSTADTASSVYALKLGPEFVQMVYGGGAPISLPRFREESVTDSNNGQYDAYVSNLTAWAGLQCVHPYAVGRICNLTAQAGKGLTDELLAEMIAAFPVGFTPDVLLMSRRSRRQLQTARAGLVSLQGDAKTGTLGGGSAYVPTPTNFEGIPIVATDSIINTEAIVA